MSATKPVEIVVYIHGVSNSLQDRSHIAQYKRLHRGIKGHAKWWPQEFSGVEWGANIPWEERPASQKSLTKAQQVLGGRLFPVVDETSDWTFNPVRIVVNSLRKTMFYGFGDMFYYVSTDGKNAVRSAVAKQIIKHINEQQVSDNDLLSLTILGHSAGSVIGFDFLFYLFSKKNAKHFCSHDQVTCEMMRLKKRIQNRTFRLRRFITFGSPIAMTACRSDAVLKLLSDDRKLDASDYGLNSSFKIGVSKLDGPRWINFWDKDDPISWARRASHERRCYPRRLCRCIGQRSQIAQRILGQQKCLS